MRFARTEMLFLIWTVPVLWLVFVYGMKKRRRILARFSSPRGLDAIVTGAQSGRRWVKAGLVLVAAGFVILALTGPRYGYRWEEIHRKGVDIIVAMDCSKSMLADDIRPSRLDRAKREVIDLLNLLQGDRVGLVAFAGTAFLQCPLTLDYETFHLFLRALSPDFLPVGGTDIHGAIMTAISGFNEKDDSEKAVILITDGEPTGADPLAAAKAAKAAGVRLFCIGVGKTQGVPVPDGAGGYQKDPSGRIVVTRLDEDTLKKIAAMTSGAYVRSVAGDMDLKAIYQKEIRSKMDLKTLKSGRRRVWEDRFQWFAAAAVLALVIEMFLPAVKKAALFILALGLLTGQPDLSHAAGFQNDLQQGLEAYGRGDYDAALKHFIDAQLDNPDFAGIYYNIGDAYYRLGDFESARKNFRQALKSDDPKLRQKVLYNLGNANFRLNRLQDAIKSYEAALKIDPEDEDAKRNLAFVKKRLEQQQQQPGTDSGDNSSREKEKEPEKKGDSESGSSKTDKGRRKSEDQNTSRQDSGKPDSRPEFGHETDATRLPKPAADPAGDAEKSTRPAGKEKQQSRASAARPAPKDTGGDDRADRILNQLKDMPGMAMMPSYGERHVEKDW